MNAAIAMYHDQALIPRSRAVDFAGGVNVTLGLPFIRTSPDHGTAFGHRGHRPGRSHQFHRCAGDGARHGPRAGDGGPDGAAGAAPPVGSDRHVV